MVQCDQGVARWADQQLLIHHMMSKAVLVQVEIIRVHRKISDCRKDARDSMIYMIFIRQVAHLESDVMVIGIQRFVHITVPWEIRLSLRIDMASDQLKKGCSF